MRRRVGVLLTGFITALGVALAAPGCEGGSGGGGGATESGEVQIALRDGASDEIDRFEVDVVAIRLERRNGAVVETLPLTTRVDFTELIEVAELLTAASVPNGAYERVSLTFDFSTASVHIVGADGDAELLDEDGEPLDGEVTLAVEFQRGRPFVVAPGLPRLLTIDFDLDASLTVDAAGNTVMVAPTVIADIDLQRPHIHRVRGALGEVDLDRSKFRLALRPFRAGEPRFGSLSVWTTEKTHFELDGVCYEGSSGLAALAELPALTAVVAVGRYRLEPLRFVADEVLAGDSVPGGNLDVVGGMVTARSGDVLTVVGARLERASGRVSLGVTVSIQLDPESTRVTKQLTMDPQETGDISVGQALVAFGALSESDGGVTLGDTTLVRMLRTKLDGAVVSAADGSLVLDLERIGNRDAGGFDFTGTGGAGGDADPSAYEVDTGALDLSEFTAGDLVQVLGFPVPFGAAPPDFVAATIVDVSSIDAALAVVWRHHSEVEFSEVSADRIVLDLGSVTPVHHVVRAWTVTDLTDFDSVALVPAAESWVYALRDGPTVTVHAEFADFAAEIEQRLADGEHVRSVFATGMFDDASGDFGAAFARVVLRRP